MNGGEIAWAVAALVTGAAAVVAAMRIRERWYVWLPLAILGGIFTGIAATEILTYLTDADALARIWPWKDALGGG